MRYRITNPTLALFVEDGRHVAHTLPVGALITVRANSFDGEKLLKRGNIRTDRGTALERLRPG